MKKAIILSVLLYTICCMAYAQGTLGCPLHVCTLHAARMLCDVRCRASDGAGATVRISQQLKCHRIPLTVPI